MVTILGLLGINVAYFEVLVQYRSITSIFKMVGIRQMRAKQIGFRNLTSRIVIAALLALTFQGMAIFQPANAAATLITDDGSNSSGWTNNVTVVAGAGNPGSAFGFSKNDLMGHSFGTAASDFSGATIQFDAKFTNVQDHIAVFWGRGLNDVSGTANALYVGPAGNSGTNSGLSGKIGLQTNASGPLIYWNGVDGGVAGTGSASVTSGDWVVDRWYTIKVAISSSSTSYYVDNTLIQTKATSIPTSNYVTIGGDDRNGWGFTNGVLVDNISLQPAIPPKVITYNYNGATGTNSVTSDTYTGTAITLPGPTKTNSTFMGWFEAADLTGTRVSSSYTPSTDLTLNAKWSSDSVAVNYNSDGGSSVASTTVVIGSAIQSAPTPPTKSGYTFGGWKATAGGSAVTFPYYPILSTGYAASVSSAALVDLGRYENKGFWVSSTWYGPNRGTSPSSTRDFATYTDGRKYIAIRESNNSVLNSPTRLDGYYMVALDASTTLTAIWTQATYSVNFNSQRGASVSSSTFSSTVSITRPSDPTRTGYKFKGWSTTSSGAAIGFPYEPSVLTDTTLYAQWEQKSLVGINTAQLVNPTVITPNGTDQTLISTRAASGNVARTRTIINYYDGALPSSYDVSVYTLPDNSFATEQLGSDKSYIISQVVAWKDRVNGDVTDTVVRKEIEMTIESTEIKSGAKVYAIVDGVSTVLATATTDGTVTVKFATDPVIVVAAAPTAPPLPPSSSGAGGTISTPMPTPLPVATFAKSFNILGFNPGSWTLTKSIKKSIDAFFKSINKPSKISCVGYTTGPTVLRGDYNLAMRRGQEVCRYIGTKNPTIANVITKGTTTKIFSDFYRRTKVTVTN
jgi:uncharacterized repeat protein (TIGR02543 family)